MADKKVYASLQISEEEVKMIVGEFFETRFNILKVHKTPIVYGNGIEKVESIKKAIIDTKNEVKTSLGFPIQRVLLAIPSSTNIKHGRKVSVPVENGALISLAHIQRGLIEATSHNISEDKVLLNVGRIKYIVNGISGYKMPLNEQCDSLTMEIDLILGDKTGAFEYVTLVEDCDIKVMDICLDSYAMAEEIAIFEQTVDKFVVLVDLNASYTSLSLFGHGKFVNSERINIGFNRWIDAIADEFKISKKIAKKLMFNNGTLSKDNDEERIIHEYQKDETDGKYITIRQLNEFLMPLVDSWVEELNLACEPIVEHGKVRYILTGDGLEMQGIENKLYKFNSEARVYVPQTIGGRSCDLVATLGMFYAYKTINEIRNKEELCTDVEYLKELMDVNQKDLEKSAFTRKFKNMLINDKSK